MNYKNFIYLLLIIFLNNCSSSNFVNENQNFDFKNRYSNKGFALIYNEELFLNKTISKKIDDRSLTIFHHHLKNK